MSKKNKYPVEKSEKAWKEELSPEEILHSPGERHGAPFEQFQ